MRTTRALHAKDDPQWDVLREEEGSNVPLTTNVTRESGWDVSRGTRRIRPIATFHGNTTFYGEFDISCRMQRSMAKAKFYDECNSPLLETES